MRCAIDQVVVATESAGRGWMCPACRIDCTVTVTGRPRRYPSDLRDEEWGRLARLLPAPAVRGRRPVWCRRIIVDAIFYLADNGCKWRALPVDFPPRSTVFGYLTAWRAAAVWDRVHDALRDQVRRREGRQAEPTAAVIDSQSVRAGETVGRDTRGWDNANYLGRWVMRSWGCLRWSAREVAGVIRGFLGRPEGCRRVGSGWVSACWVWCGPGLVP